MKIFSPKIEIINHFDELINRIDIEFEECLEKYSNDELLNQANIGEVSRHHWMFEIEFFHSLQEIKEEQTEDLWPESTKVVDYLNHVRMRIIEELRREQNESVENSSRFNYLRVEITDEKKKEELKSQLFADKFYFQVKNRRKSKQGKWRFSLFTFVTDFYMSPTYISLLEKFINAKRFKTHYLKHFFQKSKVIFDEKMILTGLLFKYFWENSKIRKLPFTNQVIRVDKEYLLKIRRIKFMYSIHGVDLNGSSSYLSKLEKLHIGFDGISGEVLKEVNIENLPSLEDICLSSNSVERITLKSLNALKELHIGPDSYYTIEKGNKLNVFLTNGSLRVVFLNNYRLENDICISKQSQQGFDLGSIYSFCNQIQKLKISHKDYEAIKALRYNDDPKNVLKFDITSYITKIEKKNFDHQLPNLLSLSLVYSTILVIDYDTFSDLKQLVELDVKSYRIESLDKRTFSVLVNLENLNLSSNRLQSVDESIFSNLKHLVNLDLSSNEIESLDKMAFSELVNLENLNLSSNRLQSLDESIFSDLKYLVSLDLQYNRIESLDQRTFSELVNLENLNLSCNQLKSLDENIFLNLKNLRELNLRKNEFETLDHKSFVGLENLCVLQLCDNKLEHFDLLVLDNLPGLKKTDLGLTHFINKDNKTQVLKRLEESKIEVYFFKLNSMSLH